MSALLGRMPSAVGYQPTLASEMGQLQERITSTEQGSITSVQAIYVPADDLTDPAPATTFSHLDAKTVLDRSIAALGIYPAVGSITSVQAIYVPADDLTDPAPATTFSHLDAKTVLDRSIAALGIYPAVDPLESSSRMLDPLVVGEYHYEIARGVVALIQKYKELQDIIAILGMDESCWGISL